MQIVDRRRRRRAKARAAVGSAAAVAGLGVTGVVGISVLNDSTAVRPASPASLEPSVDEATHPDTNGSVPLPTVAGPSPTQPAPSGGAPASSAAGVLAGGTGGDTEPEPFDPADLTPQFIESLAAAAYGGTLDPSQETIDAVATEAARLASAWDVPHYDAKVIIELAESNGTPVDPTDPLGDDAMIQRFADSGYTEADAALLADSWKWVDVKSAKILGVLLSDRPE